jgi:hypothetical protein
MAIPNNSTSYLTGGRIYSNNRVVSTNQSHLATYFPDSNGTLASVQATAALLATINSSTDPAGACYEDGLGAQFILNVNYLP